MTPEQFQQWLAEMKAAKLARSDAECARLLGIGANSLCTMKLHSGCDIRTALACTALLHGLRPYGDEAGNIRLSNLEEEELNFAIMSVVRKLLNRMRPYGED